MSCERGSGERKAQEGGARRSVESGRACARCFRGSGERKAQRGGRAARWRVAGPALGVSGERGVESPGGRSEAAGGEWQGLR